VIETIITFTLLLTTSLSPSLRIEVNPRQAIAPKEMEIRVYLRGDERAMGCSLQDEDGFVLRSSAQDLLGETLVYMKWKNPPTGDLTLVCATERERKSLDLHYISVLGF
jgi:hypothetical protein